MKTPPPVHSRKQPAATRQRLLRAGAVTAAAAALLLLYTWLVNLTGMMPRCLFKSLTGLSCPGCGSQRAFFHIIHGNIAQAWSVNAILPFGIVYLMLLFIAYLLPEHRGLQLLHTNLTSSRALTAIMLIVIAWTIIRNLLHI